MVVVSDSAEPAEPVAGVPTRSVRPSHLQVSVVGLVAVLTVAAIAFVATFSVWYGTCGGDGGYPFVPKASTAGRFCESDGSAFYFLAQFILPIVAMMAVTVVSARQRAWCHLGFGAVAVALLLIVSAVIPGSLSTTCDDESDDRSEACATY